MTSPKWNDMDDVTNSLRFDERERVRAELESRLAESGVVLSGSENEDQIVALVEAVEDFESARSRLGGDSFVNRADSSQPDDPMFVLPQRRGDESPDQYVTRVRDAARRLSERTGGA